jgi:hypothetical protein
MIDGGIDLKKGFGILILGPIGLVARKFVVFLRGFPKYLESFSFQTSRDYNPQDIMRLILKFELNEKLSTRFVEPYSDYVEQLQIDSSEDRIIEALSLKIPEKKFNATKWIRNASTEEGTEYLLYRYGDLNQIPPFSLLFANWCLGLNLKNNPDMLVSLILMGEKLGRVTIWDNPRKVAFFSLQRKESLEEISRRYFLSLWSSGKERIGPPIKTREVIIGVQPNKTELKKPFKIDQVVSDGLLKVEDKLVNLHKKVIYLQKKLDEFSISELLIRLESIESKLASVESESPTLNHSDSQVIDTQSQKRLKDVIYRLEAIASRLEVLDNRIEKISSKEKE